MSSRVDGFHRGGEQEHGLNYRITGSSSPPLIVIMPFVRGNHQMDFKEIQGSVHFSSCLYGSDHVCSSKDGFFFHPLFKYQNVLFSQRGQLAAWDVSATYLCWKTKCKCVFKSPANVGDMSPSLIPSRALDPVTHVNACVCVCVCIKSTDCVCVWMSYCFLSNKTLYFFASSILKLM